ncbi:hypothetical protein N7490_010068 [Penicillium lividum]|nr:hypothetical protein N7490_010068 [Penicillium lividum]
MPSDESSALPDSTSKERAALGRANHVFDDALTAFMMTSISPSEQSLESSLHYWLAFLGFIVQELQLYKDSPILSEDDREERRRLWWASYIIDRHVALSFNERPRIADQECRLLPPVPDAVWILPGPLLRNPENFQGTMLEHRVSNLDMLGIYLPLSKILGEILEHRFLCEHPTFNTNEKFLTEIKTKILHNLELWFNSFTALVGTEFSTIANPECTLPPLPEIPKVAYYGLHMYHCMFVLLHGPMDIVRMYKDHIWQASSDFITAGEHAVACANVARYILQVDPRLCLMYRFFGTYFLQSSFIFLILARKLGRQSDELIMRNCAINLQVLDKFVATTNMDYQHTFAKFIRRALSYNMGQESSLEELDSSMSELDPESIPYRWIPGYRGLQVGPSTK